MPDSPLQSLARRIAQTRAIDRAGKQQLAREWKNLRARLYPSVGQDVIDRADATALLMHFVAHADDSPVEAMHLVARLTAAFEDRFFAPPVAEPLVPMAASGEALTAQSRLGEILVHLGIITPEQLDEGLRIQRVWRLPLGACIERLGHATSAQVGRALDTQKRLRANAPAAPMPTQPTPATPVAPVMARSELKLDVREGGPTLGEFLIQRNQITTQQLEKATMLQRAAGVHLGEALVQLGFLTRDQVKQAQAIVERPKR